MALGCWIQIEDAKPVVHCSVVCRLFTKEDMSNKEKTEIYLAELEKSDFIQF